MLVAALGASAVIGYRLVVAPTCAVTAAGVTLHFTPEQTRHAATITALAVKRGLPARAATIALATALQESGLRNLDYGDRDSLGLFQQRPSQGWGTPAQVQDPIHATNAFYDALVKVTDYQSRDITEVAQAVQRSAYPLAYRDHEQEGRVLASALTGHSTAGLGCRLGRPDPAPGPEQLVADVRTQFGVVATVKGSVISVPTASVTHAWAVASWAVAQAEKQSVTQVVIGGQRWDQTSRSATWTGTFDPGTATPVVAISLA